jgi:hypothetical protein
MGPLNPRFSESDAKRPDRCPPAFPASGADSSGVKVEVRQQAGPRGPYVALYVDGRKVPGMTASKLCSSVDGSTTLTATFIIPAEDV